MDNRVIHNLIYLMETSVLPIEAKAMQTPEGFSVKAPRLKP
jgi:hypothetical protein